MRAIIALFIAATCCISGVKFALEGSLSVRDVFYCILVLRIQIGPVMRSNIFDIALFSPSKKLLTTSIDVCEVLPLGVRLSERFCFALDWSRFLIYVG